jgi:SOS-response transcriptional repressor LexA
MRRSTKNLPKLDLMFVRNFGEVGAGNVVPFNPRDELLPVLAPSVYNGTDVIGALAVSGRSLENEGIKDGDILICRRNITNKDVTHDTICIIYIRPTGELLAKKVVSSNGMVTLRSCGGEVKDKHYQPDDIEVRAIVIGFQRLLNENGRFTRDETIPF